jgi:phosphopantothenoylcysteine decarboxylase/phosphopantothenate--cysteine ligase
MAEKKPNLTGVNVLLGVSGGVAAYKAVELASKLRQAGANVKTVMTENACQMVGPKSFEAVTGSAVYVSLWSSCDEYKIEHIELAEWADVVVVAPATANIIGKIAGGICDDMLSTVLCACWKKRGVLAPAMNSNMWENPAVQRNIKTLKDVGFELIGPVEGALACGTVGMGRMAEPRDILEQIVEIARNLKGEK